MFSRWSSYNALFQLKGGNSVAQGVARLARSPPCMPAAAQIPLVWLNSSQSPRRHLLSSLGLAIALQEAALDDGANNCQALASLELGGKGEEPWVLHVKVLV